MNDDTRRRLLAYHGKLYRLAQRAAHRLWVKKQTEPCGRKRQKMADEIERRFAEAELHGGFVEELKKRKLRQMSDEICHVKNDIKPECGTMTEEQFWKFIRSNLRHASVKWKAISEALKCASRPSQSINKRLKWEYQCAQCEEWLARDHVKVDHIEPAGRLRDYEDLPGFVARLFCEVDGLQVLCKECHDAKTKSERMSA